MEKRGERGGEEGELDRIEKGEGQRENLKQREKERGGRGAGS